MVYEWQTMEWKFNRYKMRTITTKVYKIYEHPNREKCYEWIRENWHDLNEHSVRDVVESIKALTKIIGGSNDYSISQIPDRNEFINFRDYDEEELNKLEAQECPLTGAWCDVDVIEGLREKNMSKLLKAIHEETEYIYSDEGLFELCECNEYEFNEEGNIH